MKWNVHQVLSVEKVQRWVYLEDQFKAEKSVRRDIEITRRELHIVKVAKLLAEKACENPLKYATDMVKRLVVKPSKTDLIRILAQFHT